MLEDIRVLLFRWAMCPMGLWTMKVWAGGGGLNRKFFKKNKKKTNHKPKIIIRQKTKKGNLPILKILNFNFNVNIDIFTSMF